MSEQADAEAIRKKTYHPGQELREKARLTLEERDAIRAEFGVERWVIEGASAQQEKDFSIITQYAREQEAIDIIRCIKDAKRVHPDWKMDDIIDLLEFREETRAALKRRSKNDQRAEAG